MPVILNLKRCDNVKECGAPAACPTHAFYWDEENNTLATDVSLCIDCGKCEGCCSSGAILVVSQQEYLPTLKLIEDDPSTIQDLFVDRYGAMSVSGTRELTPDNIEALITKNKEPSAIEVLDADNPSCLISAVPYSILFHNVQIALHKVMVSGEELKKAMNILKLKTTPALIFIQNGKVIAKYEGAAPEGSNKANDLQAFVDKHIQNKG